MKFLESHFEEYIKTLENNPLINIDTNITDINNMNNLIIYGPSGTGKYSHMLKILKPLSLSELKYEKKITIISNKNNYTFKLVIFIMKLICLSLVVILKCYGMIFILI